MGTIACRLISHSPGIHIRQVYTGLSMLHRSGQIELAQDVVAAPTTRPEAPQHLRDAIAAHAKVVVNDTVRVHYDLHDAQEIDARDLDDCDIYFKRSFSAVYVQGLERGADKVRPFGLNYYVLADFPDEFAARRALGLKGWPRGRMFALREALDADSWLTFYPRVRDLEHEPDPALPARVLFLATAYDPHDKPDRSAAKIEERIQNNEVRAQCIRLLRKELGPTFLGGFNHNHYAVSHYKDCLAVDPQVTEKKNYIATLKAFPICVATTGLHRSIGWKFAEYVACARAIVSEPLAYKVPGDLAPDRNYLEYCTPDECVSQTFKLAEDRDLMSEMMNANSLYYRTYLRPDVLMLNTLHAALSAQAA